MNKNIDIELINVCKKYSKCNNDLKRLTSVIFPWTKTEKIVVLDNINLKINRGEKIAFLGKNGSGKSTILKIISSITVPDSGTVTVNRKVSTLLEVSAGFSGEFSGRENIHIRAALLGMKKKDVENLEEKIFEFAEVDDFYKDQQLKRYSSGMVSKLGFAINLFCYPEILIIDEALAVGDAGFKNKCIAAIKEMSKNDSLTLLFVSHDEKMVKEFCNRGILIHEHKIEFDGNIDEAFSHYNKTLGTVDQYLKKESKSKNQSKSKSKKR